MCNNEYSYLSIDANACACLVESHMCEPTVALAPSVLPPTRASHPIRSLSSTTKTLILTVTRTALCQCAFAPARSAPWYLQDVAAGPALAPSTPYNTLINNLGPSHLSCPLMAP